MRDYNDENYLAAAVQTIQAFSLEGKILEAQALARSILRFKPTDPLHAAYSAQRAALENTVYSILQDLLGDNRLDAQQRLLFFGDSHLYVFNYIDKNRLFLPYHLESHIIGGATAQGLSNPESKTQAYHHFTTALTEDWKPHRAVLFNLGEVDCGYAIWYRAKKHRTTIEVEVKRALENYQNLLLFARKANWNNIGVCGVTLPTIDERVKRGDVAVARAEIQITRRDRTTLTLLFNEQLKARCRHEGFHYLEITKDTLDPTTGEVDANYLHPDPADHHLSLEKTAPFWVTELSRLVT